MLQGSLENFALDEVLGLLSGTSKTGQLEIAGNRGTGSLLCYQGRLVDGTASYTANGTGLEDVMFELLRYQEGTFTFSMRDVTPGTSAENVASVLANAEARLRDWRSIEAIVPSLNHQVTPVAELPADEVTIMREEWAVLTVIASGCPASVVCDKLELGEVEGSRQIKNLAERELVMVSEPISSYTRTRVKNEASTTVSMAANTGLGGAPVNSTATPAAATPVAPQPSSVPPAPSASQAPTSLAGSPVAEARPNQAPPQPTNNAGTAPAAQANSGSNPAPAPGPALGSLMNGSAATAATDASSAAKNAGAAQQLPTTPPSPAEIAGFSENIENASQALNANEEKGGILSRYLRTED